MRRKCEICGNPCEGERCFRHKLRGGIKRKSVIALKRKDAELVRMDVEDREKMWKLFEEIWKERGPYSEISGKYLGMNMLSVFFDHLLEKAKYNSIKYEKWNIVLCTADEHTSKGNGFPLPLHKELIEKAKERYYEEKANIKMDRKGG